MAIPKKVLTMKKSLGPVELVLLLIIGFASKGGCWASPVTGGVQTAPTAETKLATFAGGCFWCMEPPFEKLPGVLEVISGYTGGKVLNPTYEQISAGNTGHYEVVQVRFDPKKISYSELFEVYLRNVDVADTTGQFCDKGPQYRAAVFYHDADQEKIALASLRQLQSQPKFKDQVKLATLAFDRFFPAEDYHQDYYKKNPLRYAFYRNNCGRDARLKELWGETRSPSKP
jgi:peptide-methionine (S)-S-oxide reductase